MNYNERAAVHAAKAVLRGEQWECKCQVCGHLRRAGLHPAITDRIKLIAIFIEVDGTNPRSASTTIGKMPDEEVKKLLAKRVGET